MDWNKAAARLRKTADKYQRDGSRYFADDAEMIAMYESDAGDLHRIAIHLEKGNFRRAMMQISNLDTAVRDLIPLRVFDALYRELRSQ